MSGHLAIFGGGQLGRMLALAAAPLGIPCRVLDPRSDACAGEVCKLITGEFDDPRALDALLEGAAAATFEFENVPAATIDLATERCRTVFPRSMSLRIASDRLDEKRHLASLGIPVAPFAAVNDELSLRAAIDEIGTPSILKSRSGGYDGKGQASISNPEGALAAWDALGRRPAVLEARIGFSRECSMIVCRGRDGTSRGYPMVENEHRSGILARTIAPAADPGNLGQHARAWTEALADSLDHVGVLTLELFETTDGLIANEFAPRVHNSGHWTIEAAATSQFENHVRAVMGLPLGPTDAIGAAEMINLVGGLPEPTAVLSVAGAHLHRYGKEPRPGRKVGHITCTAATAGRAHDLAAEILPHASAAWATPA